MYTPYLGFLSSYTYVLKNSGKSSMYVSLLVLHYWAKKVLQIAGYNTAIAPL
jgi:hypothetical protein